MTLEYTFHCGCKVELSGYTPGPCACGDYCYCYDYYDRDAHDGTIEYCDMHLGL